MNFREYFETWYKAKYGYISKHKGTAMNVTYETTACQGRWEAWQACADWHTSQALTPLTAPSTSPYAWGVQGCSRMWFGEYAEMDAKSEAVRCGGTCAAFPLYKGGV